MDQSKVLVTGGAGFIGSHACKILKGHGYTPIVLDSLERGFKESVLWGPLEVGNARDAGRVKEVIQKHRPASILHFASFINVGESVSDPETYYNNNILSTLTLASAARDFGIKNFVFSSTAAVYGVPQVSEIDESHKTDPINPYGKSKLAAEQILRDFTSAHGLRPIVFRYFNAAGADPDGELGENHEPETHLLPLILRSVLSPQAPLKVFGTDYPTPDGTCIRDYVHVIDLVEAHVSALKYLETGGTPETFNLGSSRGYSVLQAIQEAEKIVGQKIHFEIGPRRPGDPPILIANSIKAKTTLNWKPKFDNLSAMIESAWRWEQKKMKSGNKDLKK